MFFNEWKGKTKGNGRRSFGRNGKIADAPAWNRLESPGKRDEWLAFRASSPGLVLKSVKSVAGFIVQSRRSIRWWFFRSVGTLCGQSWQSSDRLWLWVVALGRMSRATPRRRPAPPSSPIPVQHVFNPCHSAPIASLAHCIILVDTVRASVLRSRGMYAGARPGMLKVHTAAVTLLQLVIRSMLLHALLHTEAWVPAGHIGTTGTTEPSDQCVSM